MAETKIFSPPRQEKFHVPIKIVQNLAQDESSANFLVVGDVEIEYSVRSEQFFTAHSAKSRSSNLSNLLDLGDVSKVRRAQQ